MRDLALTWYDYLLIIGGTAGVVVAIGGALGQLSNWARGVVSLGRRLRRERAASDDARTEPTLDQVRILNEVCDYFLTHGTPTTFRQLDKLLDRDGTQLRPHAESMPPGLLMPDVGRPGGYLGPDDELVVTVDGLRYCRHGAELLNLLARVLAFMAQREKAFMPTSDQPDLVIDDVEVQRGLGLAVPELARAQFLVERLAPQAWFTASRGEGDGWRFTLDLERLRRFRGIRDGEEFLLARDGVQSFAHRPDEVNKSPPDAPPPVTGHG